MSVVGWGNFSYPNASIAPEIYPYMYTPYSQSITAFMFTAAVQTKLLATDYSWFGFNN